MAIDFEVEMNSFPDNDADADIAAAIETWLDALSITTVHSLSIIHSKGFVRVVVVYV